MEHSQPSPPRLDQLRIVRADGGRSHHRPGLSQVFSSVTDQNPGAGSFESSEINRILPVATTDRDAELQEGHGDAVHAGTADGDEVHRPEIARMRQLDRLNQSHQAATSSTRSASSLAASTLATPRKVADIPSNLAWSSTSLGTCSATQEGAHSSSGSRIPPPESTMARALRACSPLPYG